MAVYVARRGAGHHAPYLELLVGLILLALIFLFHGGSLLLEHGFEAQMNQNLLTVFALIIALIAYMYRRAELAAAEDMEILPNIGLGPLRFGMNPSQVQALLGSQRTYEPWMGGNRNDSLLYPGLIIGFDKCDASGPLADSKLVEFTIQGRADVTFLNKPIFGMPLKELLQLLAQQNIRREPDSHILPDLHMEVDFDDQARVDWVEFSGLR